jgi:hypothetical protein
MARKQRIISVPPEQVIRMASTFNVNRATIYNALAYRSNSSTAKLVRQKALAEYGGIETTRIVF